MLRIPEFRMLIDAPSDYGLAIQGGVHLVGPTHGRFGLGVTRPQPGDDPEEELDSNYELFAVVAPVGSRGATMMNLRNPNVPFLGMIRDADTGSLFLLPPYNHAGLSELELRGECAKILQWIAFVTPRMEAWTDRLSGSTLIAADTYRRDHGGADGYSVEERYTFHRNGMYEWVKETQFTIAAGGLSASRSGRERLEGSWDILDEAGEPILRLDDSEGHRQTCTLQRLGADVLVDGRRFGVARR